MNNRYINAILIGASIGIYFLGSNACFPDGMFQFIPYHQMRHVPLWDFNQGLDASDLSVRLQYKAILLRFCLLFLEHGFYFLAIPIAFSCSLVRLNEVDEQFSGWILLRRTVKLTGAIMLSLYLIGCSFGILCGSWYSSFADPKFPVIALFSLCEAFKYAVFYGAAEVILFLAFCWELHYAAYTEPINKVKHLQTIE